MDTKDYSPLVSVIVLNYNGLRFLQNCFDSLHKATYPHVELILVDNASTDASVRYVQANYPAVKIINSGGNIGYSAGNNLGIQQSAGELLVLLNNDVEVDPGWLEPLVDEFASDPQIAACQPKLRHMIDRQSFEYAGAAGGHMDIYGFPFLRGRVLFTIEQDEGQYDTRCDLFWTSGAAMAIRRSALTNAGLLDVDFVHHMEEIDLCWRLLLQGGRLRFRPESLVYHYAGGTIKPDSYKKKYWNHRNSVFMLLKNYGLRNLLLRLPVRMGLDMVLLIKSLLTFDFSLVRALLAAWFWLLTHPVLIFRKRQVVQAQRKVTDAALKPVLYPRSLVIAYYLRGRKTFGQIWGAGL